jgi:hypothetical protein
MLDAIAELEKHIEAAPSLRQLAKRWGVSAAYLSQVRKRQRPPSDLLLEKLGLRRTIERTRGHS